jgi:hypothetical protein
LALLALESYRNLDPTEFRRLVRNGIGRAVLHLQHNDPAPYLDTVIDACRNKIEIWDDQVNGRRPAYLWDMIEASGSQQLVRDMLFADLLSRAESATNFVSDVPDLLGRFAARGDRQAHDLLYDVYRADPTLGIVRFALLDLDREAGLLAVCRQLGRLPMHDDVWSESSNVLWHAAELIGKWRVNSVLRDAARADADIAEFMRREDAEDERMRRVRIGLRCVVPRLVSFDEISSAIEQAVADRRQSPVWVNTASDKINLFNWGQYANDSDIRAAAEVLTSTPVEDRERLARYLRIFQKRAFPLSIEPLLQIIENYADREGDLPDDRGLDLLGLTGWALTALEHLSHPSVRALALELRERTDWWRGSWIGLIRNNYERGDHLLVETSVIAETDEDLIHSLCWDTLDLLEKIRIPEIAGALEVFYERNPCAQCRGKVVEALYKLDALPDWIIEECRYDSDEDTRAFVASLTDDPHEA